MVASTSDRLPSLRLPLPIPPIPCPAALRNSPCTLASSSVALSSPMSTDQHKHDYSVWAVPPDDVSQRFRDLMANLRLEFGGPEFDTHITVVGLVSLTKEDALTRIRAACEGLRRLDLEAVFSQVVDASDRCSRHFGYLRSSPYMPHLSLIYGDISDEEKKKAQEKANTLDKNLNGLSFKISCPLLCKTPLGDLTTKSGEKVSEYTLSAA